MKKDASFPERFPFTLLGTLVICSSLVLFSLSLMNSHFPGVIAGASGLGVPLLMLLIASILKPGFQHQKTRYEAASFLREDRRGRVLAAWEPHPGQRIFFRRHLLLKGSLTAGEEISYYYFRDLAFIQGRFEEEILPPLSGLLRLKGREYLRDATGLVKLQLEGPRDWDIPVLPLAADLSLDMPDFLSENKEDQNRKKKQDQEKVFTREYVAGDLARDINWKSSVRIGKLITRIPPESFGESSRLNLYFRSPPPGEGYHSLFYLDYQKSILLGFLRALNRGKDKHSFQIFLNREEYLIQDEEDIPAFERHLAELGYASSYKDFPLPERGHQSCIFSSVMDQALFKEIPGLDKEGLHLFLCIPHTVENPGPRFKLFREWPDFFPQAKSWKKGYLPVQRIPRQLGFSHLFPLSGGW